MRKTVSEETGHSFIIYLDKLLKNNKTKPKKINKSGVYKFSCGSSPKSYIGETGSLKKNVTFY